MKPADHRVSEIGASRPLLRRDLRTHYQDYRGTHTYIIEDPGKGRFFQVGLPEYQFIQSFDGKTTLAQALARNAASRVEDALTEQQGEQLLRWLLDNELLESGSSGQGHRRSEHLAGNDGKRPLNLLAKVIFFRIPLGCPDKILTRAEKLFGWLFSLPGLLLWLGLLIFTATKAAPHWERFTSGAGQVFAPRGWIYLALGYAILKVLHEFGHGIATKRFGGAVPEWGVQMLAFVTPLAYVDASASTRFPSKWQRILVSAAGMYVESALACLCLLGWIATGPGLLNSTLHGAFLGATIATVLFNINPLMRFDGYFILADLAGIPNLSGKGQQWLAWFGKKYLLGMKDLQVPQAARLHPVMVPLYGLLAGIWRIVVSIGIMILISLLFKGAGLFLALILLVGGLANALYRFGRFLFNPGSGPGLSRALPRLALLLALIAGLLFFIRINPTEKALAVVEFGDEEKLRAGMKALVAAVHVNEGDTVAAGDLLIELTNPDEENAREQLILELAGARIRARSYYQAEELAAYQGELAVVRGLEQKLDESNRYFEAARVVAPKAGRIVGRDLKSMPGRWVEVGDDLLSVVAGGRKELLVSIRQEDIQNVAAQMDREIRVRLRGRSGELVGKLDRLERRATTIVPHDALVATHGGPLALKAQAGQETGRENELARDFAGGSRDAGHFSGIERKESFEELAEPRFIARASLVEPGAASDYCAGEWGYVKFGGAEPERLGGWIYRGLLRYGRQKLQSARKAA